MKMLTAVVFAGAMTMMAAHAGFAQELVPPPTHRSIPQPSGIPPAPIFRPILDHPTQAALTPEIPSSPAADAGFATASAFKPTAAPATASGSALSAPITITYSGSSPTLQVTDSGSNKGIESVLTNSTNLSSALYGLTNGQGAGLTGYNNGTTGPAGKFGVTNSKSLAEAVLATTNGYGHAILATTSKTDNTESVIEAIAQGTNGIGIEGSGNSQGIVGSAYRYSSPASPSTGIGVEGLSESGIAVYGLTTTGYGVFAESAEGTALYALADHAGDGIVAHSHTGTGLYASSDTEQGVYGQSHNSYGVVGEDSGTGVGIYGSSSDGNAGFFNGPVVITKTLTVNGVDISSDSALKANFQPLDAKDLLARVNRLSISSWNYKTDPAKRHVGPMAQDFHAAFGLDGDDDTHINLTDIAGISLAAIQELSTLVAEKDARIATLEQKISQYDHQLAEVMAAVADLKSVQQVASR